MAGLEAFRTLPCFKKGTRLERMLFIVAAASLLLICIMTVALAYFGYHHKKNLDSTCLTPGCVKAASLLLSTVDENIDPCNDFYQFACGNWLKTHTIAEDKSSVSIYDDAQKELNLRLKTLLEAELDGTEPPFIEMLKDAYDACMDIDRIEEAGSEPLQNVLKSLGGWPVVEGEKWDKRKFDWIETLISLRKLGYFHYGLLSFFVTIDTKDNSHHTIYLDEASLGMPDRSYLISGLNDTATAAYFKRMVKAATLLGADESIAKRELFEALQLEITLANYSLPNEDKRNASKFYNKFTVKKLQEMAPQIPWLKYINGLLMYEIYENETLIVTVPEFIKKVADLVEITDERVIANYIYWRLVDESTSYLSKEWRDIDLEYLKVLTGERREKPRWENCLPTDLGMPLGSYYIRHHFKDKIKDEVSELVKYVYKEFLRILDEIDWMDENTKTHAKAKANNVIFSVGYPKELLNDTAVMELYQDLNISKDSYFENALKIRKWSVDYSLSMLRKPNSRNDWKKYTEVAVINAFYHPVDNSITLPAGYLGNPFYNKDHPNYMNFAIIGSVIGHEITHGFDDEGRQYDKDGNNVNWWEATTDESFRSKAQCVINQYSNYTTEIGMKLNGIITQGENIADIGGLKESYLAYQTWVKDNGPEQLLPGLNYNQNQLFWITAAYDYCTKFRPEELKDRITSSYHSPGKFRVIGPMSNLVEFSRDFNCPPGSPMNKKHKCQIW